MVDYSKWDRLELSDDSDIEVHPNVDKRSFIRAKQRMIHEERQKRKQQIQDLKAQREINDELLRRIQLLLNAIKGISGSGASPEEQVFKAMMEIASNAPNDKPPALSAYNHPKAGAQPTYTRMTAALIDQVKKEVDESKEENRAKAFGTVLEKHYNQLIKHQKDAAAEQARLEKEEASKITSESIHDGFNTGSVNKGESSHSGKKKAEGSKVAAVEQINPNAKSQIQLHKNDSISSGAEADVEEIAEDDSDGNIKPTVLGMEFSKIKLGDYGKCMEFITRNPSVVAEKEENGLLIEAFNSQIANKDEYAKQCVHQALLLQYCRQLGPDGVQLFFKRITTKGHQAQQVFLKDVTQTYEKLRNRARELAHERAENKEAGVETIQLQAVEPGTSINIQVPPVNHPDADIQHCRSIFESFPPGLQRALESGSLDEVNKVLAKMSVEEAEEVVEKLGEGGMLSLEQGIIDSTTEEGRQKIEELERTAKEKREGGKDLEEVEESDEDLPVEGEQSSSSAATPK